MIAGGGTGFIGKHLGQILWNKKYTIVNVSRMPSTSSITWTDVETSLPEGTNAVVNLAGQQTMDFTRSWTPG